MRREDWNKGLGEIDPELVEEYIEQKAKYAKRTGRMPLVRAIAVAACVCVVVGAVIALPIALRYGSERWLDIPDDTTSENGGALSDETTDTTDTLDPDDMFAQGSSSDTDDIGDANSAYASSYELKTVGDQLYMVFDSYEAPPIDNEITDGGYGVTFDSIEDFQRGVIKDTYFNSVYEGEGFRELSKDEMYYIVRNFERDENGIPIIDMYNLYLPDMPEGWELGWGEDYPVVDWRDGDEYVVYVSNPAENKRATFWMLSNEDYTSRKESAEQTYGDVYEISNDRKKVKVCNSMNASGSYTVYMYVEEDAIGKDLYYIYTLYGTESIPEDSYLLNLCVQLQYVSDYEIKKVGDQWYIILNSRGIRPKNYDFMRIAGISFESMSDFKYSVLNKELDINELEELARWTHDEIGIPIVDFDNLYTIDAALDPGFDEEIVWLGGERYYYSHTAEDGYIKVLAHFVFDMDFEGQTPVRTMQEEGKKLEIFDMSDSFEYYARVTEGDNVYTLGIDRSYGLADEDILAMKIKKLDGWDDYYGTYKDGMLDIKRFNQGASLVKIDVKEFTIGSVVGEHNTTENKMVLEVSAYMPGEYKIQYSCGYSDDNFTDMGYLKLELTRKPQTFEIEYIGGSSYDCFVIIRADKTQICIRVDI
ncbi:MAG: hypothetical protein IKL59_00205 [Clostridia bacterium]|nr:hypothetical protein [Clostridia bacterium]